MRNPEIDIAMTLEGSSLRDKTDSAEANLEEIYDRYAHALFRYAAALLGSAEDAEDAVQEVYLRLAREPNRLKRVENVKAYVFTATRNAAFSILRGRHRRGELQESVCDDLQLEGLANAVDVSAESVELWRAFAALPPEQREVLVLKIYDEMTFKEIARTVETSIGTVAARYRYGIAKLRRTLEEDGNG